MYQSARVDLCIPTYNRLYELRRLLDSVAGSGSADLLDSLIVIDNAARDDVKLLVEEWAAIHQNIRTKYVREHRRGIVYARNKALQVSRAELIAFIDDDELVTPGWLQNMVTSLDKTEAAVVFGRVDLQFPENAPNWLESLHGQRRPAHQERINIGSTANVLLRRADTSTLQFDLRFNRSGGEDTDFFERLERSGHRMVYCDDGVVLEPIDPNRISIRWYLMRNFRVGQTNAIVFKPSSRLHGIWIDIKKLLTIPAAVCAAIALAPVNTSKSLKMVLTSVRAAGFLSVKFSIKADEYDR
jgi:succinoglycan biosynthesis protein ExoM